MENLTWTGSLGAFLNLPLAGVAILFAIAIILQILSSFLVEPYRAQTLPDGRLSRRGGVIGLIERAPQYLLWTLVVIVLGYLVGGVVAPYGKAGIIGAISKQLTPVWI
ncbi:MAG TPA: ABC transporter permease, partial [Paracoccaceae bacterium]|nr:ABC transporter permease [Paracoccaceae bacterium]